MNDRFKFRLWCNHFNQYMAFPQSISGMQSAFARECDIIEQCTGLKDKNGKLIYEGDIVKHIMYDVKARANTIQENCEVYFDDELCEFGLRYSHALLHAQFSTEFEVIGNIHENGDLLK